MENYIKNVSNIKSAADLCSLICSIGLFYDNRGLYGEYEKYMNPPGCGGLWQNPMELATFLWENKQLFTQVRSFLDIGTFNGYTTFVIVEFLKAHVSPDIRVKTIDPNIHFHGQATEPYIRSYFTQSTIDDLAPGEEYDLVFIDGFHDEPGPLHDFNSVKAFAKFVFFHDIADRWCPYVTETFNKLSTVYDTRRTCLTPGVFGIGIIIL
jgi:Methyltransferase domain